MIIRRTDLAVEARQLWMESAAETAELKGVAAGERQREGFPITAVEVLDEEGAKAIGKPVGNYVSLELDGLMRREEDSFSRAVTAIAGELRELLPIPDDGAVLVIGLGNRAITPDLLGPLAAEHILVTRHLVKGVPDHFSH